MAQPQALPGTNHSADRYVVVNGCGVLSLLLFRSHHHPSHHHRTLFLIITGTLLSFPPVNKHCVVLYSDDASFLEAVSAAVAESHHANNAKGHTATPPGGSCGAGSFRARLVDPRSLRNAAVAEAMELPEDLPLKNGTPLGKGVGRRLAAMVWFHKFDLLAMAAGEMMATIITKNDYEGDERRHEQRKRSREERRRQQQQQQWEEEGLVEGRQEEDDELEEEEKRWGAPQPQVVPQVQWRDIGQDSSLSVVGPVVPVPLDGSVLATLYPRGVRSLASLSFGGRAPAAASFIARLMVVNAKDARAVADRFHGALVELLLMQRRRRRQQRGGGVEMGKEGRALLSGSASSWELFLDEEIVMAWAAGEGGEVYESYLSSLSSPSSSWGSYSSTSSLSPEEEASSRAMSVVDLCSLPEVGCTASSDFAG